MAIETVVIIAIGLEDNPDAVDDYIKPYSHGPAGVVRLSELLNAVAGGSKNGVVMAFSDEADGTEATDNIVCTQASAAAADTVTVLGVALTAKSSGASTNGLAGEFNIGADDDALATNLCAAINAHPWLSHIVYANVAASDTNRVFIQYRIPGPFNFGTIATSNATAFAISSGTMASGAIGTVQSNCRGYRCGLKGSDPTDLDIS